MDVIIQPGALTGEVTTPPSKSCAHRAMICAALGKGKSVLSPIALTDDMKASIHASVALGALTEREQGTLTVTGISPQALPQQAEIDCNESGSTIRFFIPIAAALGVSTLFHGRGKLPSRPLTVLVDALTAHGVECTTFDGSDSRILKISGKLQPGTYSIPGNISSQYITGLMFALPLLEGDSEIHLTTPLESKGYVDLTLQALTDSGVMIVETEYGWRIPGNQTYLPKIHKVEGDYSAAAFWLCAGAIASPIQVNGLRNYSLQGDRAVIDILCRFGARVTENGCVSAQPRNLIATDVDVSQIPDLAPVLAVVAAFARGKSTIYGAQRLRIKESDRLQSVTAGLQALGANVTEYPDRLIIRGKDQLEGGTVSSYADHRIAMAMSIAAVGCRGPVKVTGAECVAKSYPDFYDHYVRLGGRFRVI